jgi:hypothetical protein
MVPQAWISLLVFVSVIVYSVVLTIKSEEFRNIVHINSKWMIIYFFVALFVIGILTLFSVECSISGSYSSKACLYYSWIVTLLVAAIAAIFIMRTVNTFWKKDDKA